MVAWGGSGTEPLHPAEKGVCVCGGGPDGEKTVVTCGGASRRGATGGQPGVRHGETWPGGRAAAARRSRAAEAGTAGPCCLVGVFLS